MANAYQITGLTVYAKGDCMSDYNTSILLETFPRARPWTIDSVVDDDFWPEA